MNKDPTRISSVLDFLSKQLDKFEDNKNNEENYKKTKEILGIETTEGKEKIMFYLQPCEEFDGESLLEYIDSQNARLSRQKEDLIDLSVKIANLNHRDDPDRAMEEVIKNYKHELPSGIGLRDMIKQIKEHYPWSSSKKMIMIISSLMSCLVLIGLFVFDLTTDLMFSFDMFNPKNASLEDSSCHILKNKSMFPSCTQECWDELLDKPEQNPNRTLEFIPKEELKLTGWLALYHCILPFIVSIIFVMLGLQKCSVSENLRKKRWWCFNFSLCCIPNLTYIGSMVPIPALTNLYSFYLDVRCHIARSKPDFRKKIVTIQEEIRKHEKLGEL